MGRRVPPARTVTDLTNSLAVDDAVDFILCDP